LYKVDKLNKFLSAKSKLILM